MKSQAYWLECVRNAVQASKKARQRRQSFFTKLLDALWIPADEEGTHGTFAASEVIEPSPEGVLLTSLYVEGVGELHLPLSAEDTSKLRGVCSQAPFGQGLATVVDTSVRRCWQVDASKVTFPTPDFISNTVQPLAIKAVHALGLDGMQVEAHLYKLLLYETGGHFKIHRDTEKEKGMFATLIIQLPTQAGFEGGELAVRHKGSTKTFNGGPVSSTGFYYTVFFADCEHELLKVTNGTRLCLAFNLVRNNATADQVFQRKDIMNRAKKAEVVFEPWWEETMRGKLHGFGEKVAIPLQHEYTKANLSFSRLKGDDCIVAEVLKSCRDRNGEQWLDLHLCLMTKYQKKEPDSDFDDDHLHYYRDADSSVEDDEFDDPDVVEPAQPSSSTREREIYAEEIEAKNWISLDDKKAKAFEKLDIDIDTEVAVREGEEPFYDEPDDEEYVGNTGNEGASLEHWYHRAVLVVWPKRRSVSIACGAGICVALDILDRMPERNPQFYESVQQVVNYCENNASKVWETRWANSAKDPVTSRLLNVCIEAGGSQNVLLVLSLISKEQVGIRDFAVAKAIAAAVQMIGWDSCSSIIVELAKECVLSQGESFAQLAMELFRMGNRDAAVIVAKKPCELFNARIVELSQHTKPLFSWCQPLANLPLYPTVQEFLRGPQESMIYNGVSGLPDARKFATTNFDASRGFNKMFRNGYSAIGTEGGRGATAYCEIRKTRHAFEAATKHWEREQEELKRLRLYLERLQPIFPETNLGGVNMSPAGVGQHEKKRKNTEVIDLCRLDNTKKNDNKSHMRNFIDLTSDED